MKRTLPYMYLCVFAVAFLMLSACSAEKSYRFEMPDGQIVKVSMDIGDGYNLLADGGALIVQKDGQDILNGLIITNDGFEANVRTIVEDSDEIEILKAVPEDAPTLFVFQYDVEDGKEIDFLFQIENSEYAGVFMSFATYSEANAAFERVSFEMTS